MSKTITVGSQVIDFPSSAQSPQWSEGVIQFAEATADAINSVVGPFDVPPQVYNLGSFVPNTNIPALNFPTTSVRAAFIRYTVFRTTTTTTAYESGEIMIVYSPANPVNNKWEFSRSAIGDAKIDLSITDTGQIQYTLTSLPGINPVNTITFAAQSLLNS